MQHNRTQNVILVVCYTSVNILFSNFALRHGVLSSAAIDIWFVYVYIYFNAIHSYMVMHMLWFTTSCVASLVE